MHIYQLQQARAKLSFYTYNIGPVILNWAMANWTASSQLNSKMKLESLAVASTAFLPSYVSHYMQVAYVDNFLLSRRKGFDIKKLKF